MSEEARRDTLRDPSPTVAEELQAAYGEDWEIYRELLSGGKHGDWIARRLRPIEDGTNELRALTVDSLAERLEAEGEGVRDA